MQIAFMAKLCRLIGGKFLCNFSKSIQALRRRACSVITQSSEQLLSIIHIDLQPLLDSCVNYFYNHRPPFVIPHVDNNHSRAMECLHAVVTFYITSIAKQRNKNIIIGTTVRFGCDEETKNLKVPIGAFICVYTALSERFSFIFSGWFNEPHLRACVYEN